MLVEQVVGDQAAAAAVRKQAVKGRGASQDEAEVAGCVAGVDEEVGPVIGQGFGVAREYFLRLRRC